MIASSFISRPKKIKNFPKNLIFLTASLTPCKLRAPNLYQHGHPPRLCQCMHAPVIHTLFSELFYQRIKCPKTVSDSARENFERPNIHQDLGLKGTLGEMSNKHEAKTKDLRPRLKKSR